MGSSTQSSGNLGSDLAHSGATHSINLDKPPNDNSPHSSLSTSSHDIQELHPLHSDKATIKNTSGSREILMSSTDTDIDGILDITLHHARDIHNICIYGKQDVYAKFSITHTQDTVYSTQPVRGGGKNPVFNQSLQILISKLDAVLKCELWMMSCARNYLEDQLLGFVLVPLCELMGTGKSTRDYALSSTDLFHTPAGIVCLSLMFYHRGTEVLLSVMVPGHAKLAVCENTVSSGQTQGNANLDTKDNKGNHGITMVDYNSIEFPDLQVASENQQLVSMYMKMASDDSNMEEDPCCDGHNLQQQDGVTVHTYAMDDSMLQSSTLEGDCEMALNNGGDEKYDARIGSSESVSDDTGMLGDAELSSPSTNQPISQATKTTVSKQEVSGMQTKNFNNSACNNGSQATPSPRSVSSSGGLSSSDDNKAISSSDGQESVSSFTAPPPLLSLPLDPEVPVVQQDIVDMYMKSMQQFTESLAKMKLPFDIDVVQKSVEITRESQSEKKDEESEPAAVKDGHKVFYGSRAFF